MQARYPAQEFAEDTIEGFQFDMERLAVKFGMRRMTQVLLDFRIDSKQLFFPQPHEVAGALEELVAKENLEVRQRVKYQPCGRCFGGKIFVDQHGQPVQPNGSGKQDMFSKDCQCLLDWKRTLAVAQKSES